MVGKYVVFDFLSPAYFLRMMVSSSSHFPANDMMSFFVTAE